MRISVHDTFDVLKTFIQEDRTEIRLYRDRLQTVIYSLSVASFAVSAFLISKTPQLTPDQFRSTTMLIDFGLMGVMVTYFWRLKRDLVWVRKAMKARQDLLRNLKEDGIQDIDPFPSGKNVKPDIDDNDLYWTIGLALAIVYLKMLVLCAGVASFIGSKATL